MNKLLTHLPKVISLLQSLQSLKNHPQAFAIGAGSGGIAAAVVCSAVQHFFGVL
jgi:shikimate 5-dehydrogenase